MSKPPRSRTPQPDPSLTFNDEEGAVLVPFELTIRSLEASTANSTMKSLITHRPSPGQSLMFAPVQPRLADPLERKGVFYTKPWVVDLLLDLAGFREDFNLVDRLAVEPAAGEGAFIVRMAERLVRSCQNHRRPLSDCEKSLIAFELDKKSAAAAKEAVLLTLQKCKSHQNSGGLGFLLDSRRRLSLRGIRSSSSGLRDRKPAVREARRYS